MLGFVVLLITFVQFCSGFLFRDEFCPLGGNNTGICKDLDECQSAQYDLQVLRKKPGLCGFVKNTPIVCCVPTKRTTTEKTELQTKPTVSTSTKEQDGDTITIAPIQIDSRSSMSQKKCSEYGNYVYRNQSSPTLLPGILYEVINSCNVQPKFERGQVLSGEYPHLVSIGYSSVADPIFKCTGALISDIYVLTTASCTSTNFGVPQVVRLGTTIKLDFYFELPEIQHIEVSEFIRHPKYDQLTKKNDIALIKMYSAPTINALTRPACLPEESNLDSAIVVGYGSLTNYGQFQADVKEDLLKLQKIKGCSTGRLFRKGRRSEWCGQFENNQCVLDQGSPLQIVNNFPYCTYTIVGLLSSWEDCDSSKPVFITDVSKYVRWIEENIWI